MKKSLCVIALAAGVGAVGCGPAKSTMSLITAYQAIRRAEHAAGSQKGSYELFMAREYYDKAREEAGYSKYEVAEELAKKAENFAKKAAGEPVATPNPVDPDEVMP